MNLKSIILNTNLLEEQIGLFYLGQVGFIIKYREKYILIDGYLSDYVDKNCSTTNIKWIRKYPAPILGEELDFVDYVFCTHSHFDHTDPDTIKNILNCNEKALFVAPHSIKSTMLSYDIPPERLMSVSADKTYSLNGFSFIPIPSAHEQLNMDSAGEYYELGYKMLFGKYTLYHSGDCCMYNGLEERLIDTNILICPINGRDYYRNKNDIVGCFDSIEAITLAKNVKADLLIPVHFDLYTVNEVNPAYFVDYLYKKNPKQRFHIFVPGERYIFA